jgi:hypothetical protein
MRRFVSMPFTILVKTYELEEGYYELEDYEWNMLAKPRSGLYLKIYYT